MFCGWLGLKYQLTVLSRRKAYLILFAMELETNGNRSRMNTAHSTTRYIVQMDELQIPFLLHRPQDRNDVEVVKLHIRLATRHLGQEHYEVCPMKFWEQEHYDVCPMKIWEQEHYDVCHMKI